MLQSSQSLKDQITQNEAEIQRLHKSDQLSKIIESVNPNEREREILKRLEESERQLSLSRINEKVLSRRDNVLREELKTLTKKVWI